MRHTSQTIVSLIISAVAVLVAVGGFWFLYNNIESQSSVISSKLQAIYDETSSAKLLKANRELVASTETERLQLLNHLVSSDGIVEFIESLEKLGPKTGSTVSISSINSEDDSAKPAGSVTLVRALVRATGSWGGSMKMISLLENLPYEVNFDRVRIHSQGKAWEMTFELQTYKIK